MTKARSMALHEELNSMLRQGQRECLHLNGLIRKLKSGQAMLMMKKDKAKRELEVYVNKMSESLIEFKSEMHVTIQAEVEAKVKEITSLREKYEGNIRAYMELCDETEKLVQFGKIMVSESDLLKAQQLLHEFSHLQEVTSEKFEIDTLMKLEFYPALPVDCISSSIFGDLIRGSSSKPTKSSLSALSARKGSGVNDQTYDKYDYDGPAGVKIDQCTQTDSIKVSERASVAADQDRTYGNTGYGCTQYDHQQYLAYPQNSPPGFEYVTLPYCTYESYASASAPPGFSVMQRAGGPQQTYQPNQLQASSCMHTGVPVYHQGSQYSKTYTALATTPVTYPVQNIPLYTCNNPESPERTCFYQTDKHYTPVGRKSCAIPIKSPGTDSEISDIHKEKTEKWKKDIVKKMIKSEHQIDVKNIPLPAGPAPKENIDNCKSKKQAAEELESESVQNGNMTDKKHSQNVSVLAEVKQEKMENEDNKYDCDTEDEGGSNMEKLEKRLKRITELLEFSAIDEMDETKRFAESFEALNEIRNVEGREDVVMDEGQHNAEEKSPVHKMEIDHMLSNIGHDLKEKIAKGKEIISPMKPLRRPLRLPKNVWTEPKTKIHPATMSENVMVNEQLPDRMNDSRDTKEHPEINNAHSLKSDSESLKVKTEIHTPLKSGKPECQGESESEYVAESAEIESEDSGLKQEEAESSIGPDILDLSSSTGVNLRDAVKGHGLSKRELTEMNKETLQSQTNWLKGYLKQILPGMREKKSNSSNLEISDENNNSPKECVKSEMIGENQKLNSSRKDDKVDTEIVTSVKVAETDSVDSTEKKPVANKSSTEMSAGISDKTENNKKNSEDINEDSSTCPKSSCVGESGNTNSNPNKSSNVMERKTDLKNLKSAVKGFLDPKESKQRSMSTYSRLGALQAHWLKTASGTNIQAKFLFECSHKMHFPIGVTTNSLQQVIVADTGNHCVKMFDQDGKFIRDFKGEGMRRPSAIIVNEFDHVFVKDDVSIRVFDNHGDYITEIAKDLYKPFGLVLTPAKCLLVLETDRRHPALVHISQDGVDMWRFPYTPLMNAPLGSKCRFMGVSENNVVVSDLGLSQIYITNLEGIFFKAIGSFGTGIMQFFEPSGISVDNYGNIVIGDSKNNRIQVYRHDGSYTGLVQFDEKIARPSGIHLTSDNKLMVVNFLHHVVKVYQLLA